MHTWFAPAHGSSRLHAGGVHVFVAGSQISRSALPQSSADSHALPGDGVVSKLIAANDTQSPFSTSVECPFSPTCARRSTTRAECAANTGPSGSVTESTVSDPLVAR